MSSSGRSEEPGNIIAREVESLSRVAFGSLAIPAIERQVARIVFLGRISVLCQQDLADLRDFCLPVYRDLFETGRKRFPNSKADFPEIGIANQPRPSAVILVNSW